MSFQPTSAKLNAPQEDEWTHADSQAVDGAHRPVLHLAESPNDSFLLKAELAEKASPASCWR